MTSWILIALSTVFAVGVDGAPQERGRRGVRNRGPENIQKFVEQVADEVGATEEQVAQLETIAAEHKAAMDAAREAQQNLTDEQREELGQLHRQVRAARRDGDEAEVEKLREQIHTLMGADPRATLKETHEKIAAVLTEEQLPAFKKLMKKMRRGGMEDRLRGRRGPGRRGGERGPSMERFATRLAAEIELTEEQQQSIDAIVAEHKEAADAARQQARADREANAEELKELREEMRDARADGDTEAMQKLREEMRALMAPETNLFETTLEKIGAVLTEEQQPEFDALVAQAKERMGKARERFGRERRGRGDGPREGRRGRRIQKSEPLDG